MMRFGFVAILVSIALVMGGCALTGTVADSGKTEVTLKNVKLESGGGLRIRHGESQIILPLKSIRTLTLVQANAAAVDRGLYYNARIELKDGTVFSSDTKAGTANDTDVRKSATLVYVNDVLIGRTGNGTCRIGLHQISSVVFK